MVKRDNGQYFTVSEILQEKVFHMVKNKGTVLLEPSFGAGHLLKKFKDYDPDYKMVCYELDENIEPIINFNENQEIIYTDFTKNKICNKFKTIVGNPPYIKHKTGNIYIKFIEICYNLLDENGEIVFIVPTEFLKLTSASKLINLMNNTGSFTDFYFPNDERLFLDATVDIMIFRYQRGLLSNETVKNDIAMNYNVIEGILTFYEKSSKLPTKKVNDIFDLYVGMVSGKDSIFKNRIGNVDVLTNENKIEKFIYITEFPSKNNMIDDYLEQFKNELMNRKIKKFTDKNWFEWGAPRNIKNIYQNWGKMCIYVKNITRNKNVAFLGKVGYFGGSLLCLIPKDDLSCDLKKYVDYFNTDEFKKNYVYSNRFKIGHKQLSNSLIEE